MTETVNGSGGKVMDKMFLILSDGQRHTVEELHACCATSTRENVQVHISNLRKKLPVGHDIVCVNHSRKTHYQLVRLVGSANSGRQ